MLECVDWLCVYSCITCVWFLGLHGSYQWNYKQTCECHGSCHSPTAVKGQYVYNAGQKSHWQSHFLKPDLKFFTFKFFPSILKFDSVHLLFWGSTLKHNNVICIYVPVYMYVLWKAWCFNINMSNFFQWEVKAPMPSMCFRSICKQISKMHEAVLDILPADQVKVSILLIY